MDLLGVSFGIVFLVDFPFRDATWSVRLRSAHQHGEDEAILHVVNATDFDTGQVLSGGQWEGLLDGAGLIDSFRDLVVYEWISRLGGGGGPAEA